MRIDEYYRCMARINLNASLLALFPAVLLIASNLLIFHLPRLMLLTPPFFIYSIVYFQIYLFKKKQAMTIEKNLRSLPSQGQNLFETGNLAVLFVNTFSPQLMIYFTDGYLAAVIKKCKEKGKETFSLYNSNEELIGNYLVKGKRQLKIEVYDQNNSYIGCYERTRIKRINKDKRELMDAKGRFAAAVEGASLYMDEQVMDARNRLVCRLRRGWMPLEWSTRFPDPNIPVLSLSNRLNEKDKILQMSFLINEFFFER